MAASDARLFPRKNEAYRVTFAIYDGNGDPVTGAATLDSEVSLDGAAFADCTNETTEIAQGFYYLDLTAAEMNADTVAVIVKTSTSGAKSTLLVFYPLESTDIPTNTTAISGDTVAADNLEADYDGNGFAKANSSIGSVSGAVGSVTGSVGGSVASVTAPVTVGTNNDKTGYALSGAGVTAVQSGLATGADLATVDGNVDTILTRTDVATSTRLASASYTAPDNAGIDAIEAALTANLDVAVSTRLASASYTAPDNASVATILTRTDVATSTRATPAQVNSEVVDALATDTYAEPNAVPAATATLAAKIGWLMALARNKRTTTATTDTLRNDADSGNIATAAISDDGTSFTRGEYT